MGNLKKGIGGGLSGAAGGAAVGSAIMPGIGTGIGAGVGAVGGFLGSFFGGDDAEELAAKRAQMFEDLMKQYVEDPRAVEALSRLRELSNTTGLTPQEKATLLQAERGAADFSRGREGAIRARALGGSAGTGGTSAAEAVLEEQAAQASSERVSGASAQAAGAADQRRRAALDSFLAGSQRNQAMLNQYKLNAAGMYGNALQGQQDYAERKQYADDGNLWKGVNDVAGGAMSLAGTPPVTPQTQMVLTPRAQSQLNGPSTPAPLASFSPYEAEYGARRVVPSSSGSFERMLYR